MARRGAYRLAALYETDGHEVVLSSPDKVDQKYTSHRNRVVRFLSTQKSRAMDGSSDRVNNRVKVRSPQEREHAARALAAMLGRCVHSDQLGHAQRWLADIESRDKTRKGQLRRHAIHLQASSALPRWKMRGRCRSIPVPGDGGAS